MLENDGYMCGTSRLEGTLYNSKIAGGGVKSEIGLSNSHIEHIDATEECYESPFI